MWPCEYSSLGRMQCTAYLRMQLAWPQPYLSFTWESSNFPFMKNCLSLCCLKRSCCLSHRGYRDSLKCLGLIHWWLSQAGSRCCVLWVGERSSHRVDCVEPKMLIAILFTGQHWKSFSQFWLMLPLINLVILLLTRDVWFDAWETIA